MAARRHLCCYIQDEVHVGCDEVATRARGSYGNNFPSLYCCDDHREWLNHQPLPGHDLLYYKLIQGFDPKFNSDTEIATAIKALVKAGVLDYMPPPPPPIFEPGPYYGDDF